MGRADTYRLIVSVGAISHRVRPDADLPPICIRPLQDAAPVQSLVEMYEKKRVFSFYLRIMKLAPSELNTGKMDDRSLGMFIEDLIKEDVSPLLLSNLLGITRFVTRPSFRNQH